MGRNPGGLLLVCVLLMVALLLWGCWDENASPTPWDAEPSSTLRGTECAVASNTALEAVATVWPLWTRCVAAESTLSVVETLVDELAAACGGLWDACCAPATLTAAAPVATGLPVATYAPLPTYTAYPSATAEPSFCRRCIPDDAEFGCPGGYVCEACDVCYNLCVPADSPRSGCDFCAGILIP